MPAGKANPPRVIDLGSLCRAYTEANIRRLGGMAGNPKTNPLVAMRAIEILLDRGYGRPSQEHTHAGTAEDGSHIFVLRHIYEGKPKGEK